MYINLLENGWTLNQIDNMDILFYMDLLSYKANKEYKDNVEAMLGIL